MCKMDQLSHILRKISSQIYAIFVMLEYLAHIFNKSSTQIYAMCVILNTNHTFWVKATRNAPFLGLILKCILRSFPKKLPGVPGVPKDIKYDTER